MVMTPQRIVLKARGRYDEAPAGAALYPGMVGKLNSTGQVIPQNVSGAGGPLIVMIEDALRGADITQPLPSGDTAPFYYPAKGDVFLLLLQNLQNVAQGSGLMNAGDGTVVAWNGNTLYSIIAPSTVVTNVATETTFSNGTYTAPANFFQVGDIIHIRAKAVCVAVNSTNTHRIRVYIGSTALADSAARALIAADYVLCDIVMTVRSLGAAGAFIADGTVTYTISGVITSTPFTIATTAVDTTAAQAFTVTTLASAQSTGNQIRLDEYVVEIERDGGIAAIAYSNEAINNSAGAGSSPISGFGTAAFIRCTIP